MLELLNGLCVTVGQLWCLGDFQQINAVTKSTRDKTEESKYKYKKLSLQILD